MLHSLVWCCLLCSLFWSTGVHAHAAPASIVQIDLTLDGAQLEQDVPIGELELALHDKLVRPGEDLTVALERSRALLFDYALHHIHASASGQAWDVEVRDVRAHRASDGPRAIFQVLLRAPGGEVPGSFELHDDLVTHEVMSHHAAVFVRSDWTERRATSRLVGTMQAGRSVVTISRGGSLWQGVRRVAELGADHIATGTDHLLFLFALVLVAPLAVVERRWVPRPSTLDVLRQLLRVVTAFTLGHSLTLALGAIDGLSLPGEPVEVAIALSVLVAACNAWRPVFAGREALLALGFGLVHGLAFATSIAEQCLGTTQTLWTLLAFNLGIELAQLALLLLVVPWLLLLARTPAYAPLRKGGAALTACFAVGWLLERTGISENPTAGVVAWLEQHPLPLLVTLAFGAVLARTRQSGSHRSG